jgi:hypothetical protein
MGITEVRSRISSTRRSDSTPAQPGHGFTASHQSGEEPEPRYALPPATDEEGEPEPRSSDAEGEQEMVALPPVEEEPRADNVDPSGSGQPLGSCNPEYLRQFEALMRMKIFSQGVPGASAGIVGPED